MLVELGRELRKARDAKKASLAAAARPAGISATYLQKLERGAVNDPSPRVLARIAVVLEVPYLRLMELAGYLDERQSAEARLHERASKPHPLAGQKLTSQEWRAVGDFIRRLIAGRSKGAAGSPGGCLSAGAPTAPG
jgi:transcriptional regulator with XRE-family HTH domain